MEIMTVCAISVRSSQLLVHGLAYFCFCILNGGIKRRR